MRKHAAGLIRKRVRKPDSPPTIMVGCGGNFTSLLTLAAASRGVLLDRNSPALTSLGPVSRAQVRTMLDELRAMSLEQRLRVPGLPSDRADIVVAGLATIERLMKHLGATQLHVHPGGFREGLLMRVVEEMLRERTRDAVAPGDEEELGVVREFARACSYPRAHCEHVATLSLSLYDQFVRGSDLIKGLGSDRSERMMLEASCVLHDIGVLVEYDRHHRHGALMVRHAELRGLTARQIEVLACLVRYHRKREPTVRHAEFETLSETDRALVRRLSGLMRVADGLDRSHAQNVRSVHVRFGADGATIEVDSRSDASADIEAALDKAGLLESVMGTRLRIQPTAQEPSGANTGRTEGAMGTNRSASRGAAATVGEDVRGGEAPGRTPRGGAGLAGPSTPVTPVTPVTPSTPIAPGMANGQHTEPHG
jgi:exopolyphosphatase/guanosine-5'-triphosphate,3'-diphosphate pyrophosphatase